MNDPRSTHSLKSASTRTVSIPRRAWRRALVLTASLALASLASLAWHGSSRAAERGALAAVGHLLGRVAPSLRAALSLSPAPAQAAGPSSKLIISTVAGGGLSSDVPAQQAPMVSPTAVARDPLGRGFYVVDEINSTSYLRFVNTSNAAVVLAGVTVQPNSINLIAGGGTRVVDGLGARDVDLTSATGLAVDPSGNAVYLATPVMGAIRVINVGSQDFSIFNRTIAPGTVGTAVALNLPDFRALALHPLTQEIYFIGPKPGSGAQVVFKADGNGDPIVAAGGGTPQVGNGDGGPANQAKLVTPLAIAFDSLGNLYIADGGDTRLTPGNVRKVDSSGNISTLAADLQFPTGIVVGPGSNLYAALGNTAQIVRLSQTGLPPVRVAGNSQGTACDMFANPTCGDGGSATSASLNLPGSTDNKTVGLAADATGLYIPDFSFKRVRYVNLSAATVTIAGTSIGAQKIDSIVGNGLDAPYDNLPATAAELKSPVGVAADGQGNLYISDTGNNHLRFVNRGQAPVTLFASTPSEQVVPPGQIVSLNKNAGDPKIDDRITTAIFSSPQGLAVAANGVFIVDAQGGVIYPPGLSGRRSGLVRFLNTSASDVTVFGVTVPPSHIKIIAGIPAGTRPADVPGTIGDGGPATSSIVFPTDVAVDGAGNLYIADQGNNRIRKVDTAAGTINSVRGILPGGLLGPLTTGGATGIALDGSGRLYIADTKNHRVLRQDTADGTEFSIIADGSLGLNRPRDLTVDDQGQVFITNSVKHQIVRITAPDNALGTAVVAAGNGSQGYSGDGERAELARLNLPTPGTAANDIQVTDNIITLPDGHLLFADGNNNRIRLLVKIINQPPTLNAIGNQMINEGTSLQLNFTATDANGDALVLSISGNPAFGTFTDQGNGTATLQLAPGYSDAGSYNLTVTASDGELTASQSFALTVNDSNRAPIVSADAISTPIEATSSSGAVVHLSGSATDADGDAVTLAWFDGANQIATGAVADVTLGFGAHAIFLMATDSHNASASTAVQNIIVRDSTPPVINQVPANQSFEADTLGGRVFTFSPPTATDNIDGALAVNVSGVPAGNLYPVGTTTITFTATDARGNQATASFTVMVTDTAAPTISGVPASITVEATSPSGATVNYTMPTASDIVDGAVMVTASKASGTVFPVGLTNVTFTATDAHNNTATASFTVSVTDTTKPVISNVPTNVTVEATGPNGATVNYTLPAASDIVDGAVAVVASHPSGSVFPLGTTVVNFTATDARGNSAAASFSVTVQDTTAPSFSNVPANMIVPKNDQNGATVNYTMPAATDLVDGQVTVTASHPSGSLFPFGTTTVTFTATDAHSNTVTASFTIKVVSSNPPTIAGVPADMAVEATSTAGAVVNYAMPTATDEAQGTLPVTTSKPSGSVFPFGITTVTFTATNEAGLTATASFKVTVRDTTAPVLSGVPANQIFEGDTLGGKVFNFAVTASDTVQGSVTVNVSGAPPANLFPVGVTTVALSATDASGNTATASFTVTVTDTQGPTISGVPADINTDSTSPAGAIVNYTMPTAFDRVEGNIAVTADKPSGMLFPVGTTTVNFTATDSRGNKTMAAFNVTVNAEPTYTILTIAGSGSYGFSGNGGPALSAAFKQITALALDATGNLFIVDGTNRVVRRVDAQGTIQPFAGNTTSGNAGDGKAAAIASFGSPAGIAVDGQGNVYLADTTYHRIRRITPDGKINHFAGDAGGAAGYSGDGGLATSARLRGPTQLAVDGQGNLYLSDTGNDRIRRIDATTRVITTVAGNGIGSYSGDGGLATSASLNRPQAVAVDAEGNLYIADLGNHRLRKVEAGTNLITTIAGNGTAGYGGDEGPAALSVLNAPVGVAVDGAGNVYIGDQQNQRVRRIAKATGKIKTIAGQGVTGFAGDGGLAAQALLSQPAALIVDAAKNVFLADNGNLRVRKLATGSAPPANRAPVITSSIANQTLVKGQSLDLQLSATDEDGDRVTFTLLNAPAFASIINANPLQGTATLRLAPGTQTGTFANVQVQASDGKGGNSTSAAFTVTVNDAGPSNQPPIANSSPLPAIVEATSAAGAVVNLNGSGTDPDGDSLSFTWSDNGTVIATSATAAVTLGLGTHGITLTVSDGEGGASTTVVQIVLVKDSTPPAISGVPANITIAATSASGANVTYTMPTAVDLVDGSVAVIADKVSGALFPVGTTTVNFAATDSRGNAAAASFTVTVTPPAGSEAEPNYLISTFAGSGSYGFSGNGGPALSAAFKQITALAFDPAGNLFLVDGPNRVVRRIDAQGTIQAFAGNTTSGNTGDGKAANVASFGSPSGIAVDGQGQVYIADTAFNRIRKVGLDGKITHFAGDVNGGAGYSGDGGSAASARLRGPTQLAVDGQGNLYLADTGNDRIRRIDAVTRIITTVAGNGISGYSGDGMTATSASLNRPQAVAVDAAGNLYLADLGNHRLRKVEAGTNLITTMAGNGTAGYGGDEGPAALSVLNAPAGVAVDGAGNVYIGDQQNQRVRRIAKATGRIKTIAGQGVTGFAGDGGPAVQALLSLPGVLVCDAAGNILIGDSGNLRVRRLASVGGPPPTNNAPVIANIANQLVAAGGTLDVLITASDADGDPVTLSLANAPAFVTLTGVNPAQRRATLHIAPGSVNVGAFNGLVVMADDGRGGTSQSNSFSITVSGGAGNRPPVANAASLASFVDAPDSTGAMVHLDGSASSDPDGDSLSFTWTDNGTAIADTAVADVKLGIGAHSIVLTVSDGRGGTSSTAAQNVTVNGPASLRVDSISPNQGQRGATVTITVNGAGFTPQSTVNISGGAINVRTTYVSSTKLTATLQITNSALISVRSVTVINPGGAFATLTNVFYVRP